VRLVIDPGHGHPYTGVVYEDKVEADAAFELAKTLKWVLLEELNVGFKVLLTRTDGMFVPFHKRTGIPADLLLSIHFDIPNGGMPIYYQQCRDDSAYVAHRLRILTGNRNPVWSTKRAAHQGGRLYIDDAHHVAVLWEADTIDNYKHTKEYRLSLARPMAKAVQEVMNELAVYF